ncbi:hypothetical protein BC830DRAFT_247087 [Chytriomyces sp. MP71]|nr:hypothetical protein BC830DRAFT_247087 [Chytriomyces sp. MP71]
MPTRLTSMLAALLPLLAMAQTVAPATASHCVSGNTMWCMSVETKSDGTAVVTVQSASTGWAAVGIGATGMSGNAPAFVGWNNGNSVVVSARTLVSENLPPVAASAAQVVPITSTIMQGANIAFAFTVSASLFASGSIDCVYAMSPTPPANPGSQSSMFSIHSSASSFQLSLKPTVASVAPPPPISKASTVISSTAVAPTTSHFSSPAQSTVPSAGSEVASGSVCASGGTMLCVDVNTMADGTALVTVQSAATGWAAVGFGTTRMSGNAPAFVGWNNGNNVVVSARQLVMEDVPPVAATAAQVVPVTASTKQDAKIIFAFTVPASLFASGSIDCVYALSPTAPSTPSSSSSTFMVHTEADTFKMILTSGGTSATNVIAPTSSYVAPEVPVATSSPSTNSTNLAVSRTQSQSTFCADSSSTFCVVAIRDDKSHLVSFTMYSAYSGWMGMGTGRQMDGSTMFVAWKNNAGKMVVSQRMGSGHSTPSAVSGNQYFFIDQAPAGVQVPSSAVMVVTFTIPTSANLISLTGGSSFIYGVSDSKPINPDSSSSSFSQHNLEGTFSLDVSRLGIISQGAADDNTTTLRLWHGIVMFLAWGVVPFACIFAARYLKSRLGHAWYLIHMGGFLYGWTAAIS